MCRRTTCKHCGKATYSGCGMHVEQVLAGVPHSQRCDCDGTSGKKAGIAQDGRTGGGFMSRLFRRG